MTITSTPENESKSLADLVTEDQLADEQKQASWKPVSSDYTGQCPQCARPRMLLCANGKHVCEKCQWCPEDNAYAPNI
ncbi:hypothetical protein [Noviherbaspirillum malthae]|uniref:hypothetical protein n=1 Tax=Noviherbaspirillum malthae TaxID=1260987 RepID=UPI00188FB29B|nr:hypothetical protein [Noviherbaspirillum malthae]